MAVMQAQNVGVVERHEVNVRVRDVHAFDDEADARVQDFLVVARDFFCDEPEIREIVVREIVNFVDGDLRDDERVAVRERVDVEDRDRARVLVNFVRREFARDDFLKNVFCHETILA